MFVVHYTLKPTSNIINRKVISLACFSVAVRCPLLYVFVLLCKRHPPSAIRLHAFACCGPCTVSAKLTSDANPSCTLATPPRRRFDMIRPHHDYHNGVAALVHSEPQVSNFQNPYDIPLLIPKRLGSVIPFLQQITKVPVTAQLRSEKCFIFAKGL